MHPHDKFVLCEVVGCGAEADFEAPAHLCESHWRKWFSEGPDDDPEGWLREILLGGGQDDGK